KGVFATLAKVAAGLTRVEFIHVGLQFRSQLLPAFYSCSCKVFLSGLLSGCMRILGQLVPYQGHVYWDESMRKADGRAESGACRISQSAYNVARNWAQRFQD